MKKYRAIKRGIGIRHGDRCRSGFIVDKHDDVLHYLLDEVRRYENGVREYRCLNCYPSGYVYASIVMINPEMEIYYGELANFDGSERHGICVEALVLVMY